MTPAFALQRVAWRHPEWGAVGVAAVAWAALFAPVLGPPQLQTAHAELHASAPMAAGVVGWLLMTTAMMVPASLPVARDQALGAVWARRQRTVALFLAGAFAVWALFGLSAAAGADVAEQALGAPRGMVLAIVLAAAAAWELTTLKWRAVRACHLVRPLPPRGARADRACVASGIVYGRRCVASCWGVMAAMAVAGHQALGLLVVLALVVGVEKVAARPARLATPIAAALAADALIALTRVH